MGQNKPICLCHKEYSAAPVGLLGYPITRAVCGGGARWSELPVLHSLAASPAHAGNFPGWGSGWVFSKQQGFPLPPGEAADAAGESPPWGAELLQHICCGKELMVSCCVRLGGEVHVWERRKLRRSLWSPLHCPSPAA